MVASREKPMASGTWPQRRTTAASAATEVLKGVAGRAKKTKSTRKGRATPRPRASAPGPAYQPAERTPEPDIMTEREDPLGARAAPAARRPPGTRAMRSKDRARWRGRATNPSGGLRFSRQDRPKPCAELARAPALGS